MVAEISILPNRMWSLCDNISSEPKKEDLPNKESDEKRKSISYLNEQKEE